MLYVCVLYPDVSRYRQTFLQRTSPIILFFFDPSVGTQFQREPFSGGVKFTGVGKMRFSIEFAVYIGNSTR